jgi:hypothetical protein
MVQPDEQGKRPHVTVKKTHGSKKRAAWAPGYVRAALEAAVASARFEHCWPKVVSDPSTEQLVDSVVAAVATAAAAAAAAAAPSSNAAAAAAAAKKQLGSSLAELRHHLDYGRGYGRSKVACCYSKGLLLAKLQVLLGMPAKAAPLDRAIGLLKDLAHGLASGKSAAKELQAAGVAGLAGLAAKSRVAQLKELAKQYSKTSVNRAAAARVLLLGVLEASTAGTAAA